MSSSQHRTLMDQAAALALVSELAVLVSMLLSAAVTLLLSLWEQYVWTGLLLPCLVTAAIPARIHGGLSRMRTLISARPHCSNVPRRRALAVTFVAHHAVHRCIGGWLRRLLLVFVCGSDVAMPRAHIVLAVLTGALESRGKAPPAPLLSVPGEFAKTCCRCTAACRAARSPQCHPTSHKRW